MGFPTGLDIGAQQASGIEAQVPARAGQEPYATWLKLLPDAPIPYLNNVEVVVVGGSGNVRWGVNECTYSKSVKVDDWR